MRTRIPTVLLLVASSIFLAACGGGRSGTPPTPVASPQAVQPVVVRYDHDGDQNVDYITVDTARVASPIMEAVLGGFGGAARAAPELVGQSLVPELSRVLTEYANGDQWTTGPAELEIAGLRGNKIRVFSGVLGDEEADVHPGCAAPGDPVLIHVPSLSADPVATIGGVAAEIVFRHEDILVLRVPEGLPAGEAVIDVDGHERTLHVLSEGAPVIHYMSASRATAGSVVFLIGRRLHPGVVAFLAEDETVVAEATLDGGKHCAFFEIPEDLATGSYELRVTNELELDTGPCARSIEVVEASDAKIETITPALQPPGRRVTIEGAGLGPQGIVSVEWTDADGKTLFGHGMANGFDLVETFVPNQATPGTSYDVTVELYDWGTISRTNAVAYEVGTPPDPTIAALDPTEGPAGSLLALKGEGLLGGVVCFTPSAGGPSVEAYTNLFCWDCRPEVDGEAIQVLVPFELADGLYDVTVKVGDKTSNAVAFTVKDVPPEVTSMKPTVHEAGEPVEPVMIEGRGFGVGFFADLPNIGLPAGTLLEFDDLAVTWDLDDGDATGPQNGIVIFHDDRRILCLPPGGLEGLPVGTYHVKVIRDPGSDEEEVADAGTYTVN